MKIYFLLSISILSTLLIQTTLNPTGLYPLMVSSDIMTASIFLILTTSDYVFFVISTIIFSPVTLVKTRQLNSSYETILGMDSENSSKHTANFVCVLSLSDTNLMVS